MSAVNLSNMPATRKYLTMFSTYLFVLLAGLMIGIEPGVVNIQAQTNAADIIRIGLVADIQYCDCPSSGSREYRLSLSKLDSCITELNQQQPDFIVDLGDRIDRDYSSFASIDSLLSLAVSPVYFVPGNHDFSVKIKHKKEILRKTNSPQG